VHPHRRRGTVAASALMVPLPRHARWQRGAVGRGAVDVGAGSGERLDAVSAIDAGAGGGERLDAVAAVAGG
jgi:hypothetical protein